jgi:hypothetical protein
MNPTDLLLYLVIGHWVALVGEIVLVCALLYVARKPIFLVLISPVIFWRAFRDIRGYKRFLNLSANQNQSFRDHYEALYDGVVLFIGISCTDSNYTLRFENETAGKVVRIGGAFSSHQPILEDLEKETPVLNNSIKSQENND